MNNGQVEEVTAQADQVEHVKIQQLSSGNRNFFSFAGRKDKPRANKSGLDFCSVLFDILVTFLVF